MSPRMQTVPLEEPPDDPDELPEWPPDDEPLEWPPDEELLAELPEEPLAEPPDDEPLAELLDEPELLDAELPDEALDVAPPEDAPSAVLASSPGVRSALPSGLASSAEASLAGAESALSSSMAAASVPVLVVASLRDVRSLGADVAFAAPPSTPGEKSSRPPIEAQAWGSAARVNATPSTTKRDGAPRLTDPWTIPPT
jgi:hypothetical protein